MAEGLKMIAPEQLKIVKYDVPKNLNEGEVLLRVKAGGVCGSDLHIYDGSHPIGDYPKILGHEFAGVVEKTGPGVNKLAPGDTVVADPIASCGTCRSCTILKKPNICSNLQVRGVHLDGGFCTHIVIPAESLHRFTGLDWKEAVLVEPFTIAAQILDRCSLTEADTILINGSGSIGLSTLILAKLISARVISTDLYDDHLAKALELKADLAVNPRKSDLVKTVRDFTGGDGVSVIVESVGATKTLNAVLGCAAFGARITVIGFDKTASEINPFDITFNEWEIIGSRLQTRKFAYVIDLFESGKVKPSSIVSHVFPYREAAEVFPFMLANPEKVNKVILEF